jgi:hypothetical protein
MSLKRVFDAEFINRVVNDESVRGGAEVDEYGIKCADFSDVVSNVNNHILVNGHGGFVYAQVAPNTYEVHTQFLPSGRGAAAYHAALESLRYMFINTDCMRVISKTKTTNTGAAALAAKALTFKGVNGDYNYYSLEYMEWVERDKENKKQGELFHKLVEDDTNHDDDDIHDYHVGGALSIALKGNALKAQQVYNYWAIASGYEMAVVDSLNPLILSVGYMRLLITDKVEVI